MILVITFWETFHDMNLTYIGELGFLYVMNKRVIVPAKVTTESVC